jgi:peptidoglycan/xylan/chitin deacetylase (PgdA/CDA1 family)
MKSILRGIFHHGGGLHLTRWQNRSRNRILTYHHFESSHTGAFEEQCEHILRYYKPVSLDEVAACVCYGKALPLNSVAITVDDGYRDFYLYAYPILRRRGIPATVFLMTDFLDRSAWPWWDQLWYAFFHTRLDSITLRITEEKMLHRLHDAASKAAALEQTAEALKAVPNTVRLNFIANLAEVFRIDIPKDPPPGLEPMKWQEVREMAANGISFGPHTKSHPILASIGSDEELGEEIQGSKLRIQEELGSAPAHFCYPNGRREDVNKRVRSAVAAAGFLTAVSTEAGWNEPGSDPYMLRRLSMEPGVTSFYFRQQLAGFRIH